MKCYKIDAHAHTVTELEISRDYRDIYKVGEFDCFDLVRMENGDAIYVDDEGLFKPQTDFFVLRGYEQPLAGNGVVLGCDEEGSACDPKISLDDLKLRVVFLTKLGRRFFPVPADPTDEERILKILQETRAAARATTEALEKLTAYRSSLPK